VLTTARPSSHPGLWDTNGMGVQEYRGAGCVLCAGFEYKTLDCISD
jgi:hypothetical protein